jgi:hypothetical protein
MTSGQDLCSSTGSTSSVRQVKPKTIMRAIWIAVGAPVMLKKRLAHVMGAYRPSCGIDTSTMLTLG